MHLSAPTLENLELGLMGAPERAAAEGHLAECARCRDDLEALREARARFDRDILPRTLPRVLRAQRRRRLRIRAAILAGPLLAAAAALLLFWPGRPEGILIKGGGVGLRGFARRGDHVFAVADGTRLQAGDDLRFVVEPGGHRYALVVSVDGAGHASVYFPYGGAASALLGRDKELPGSIHLDDAPGPERVFALFSDAPISAEIILAGLRGLDAAAIRAGVTLREPQASFWFEKETH